jgi:hypothetical protein
VADSRRSGQEPAERGQLKGQLYAEARRNIRGRSSMNNAGLKRKLGR